MVFYLITCFCVYTAVSGPDGIIYDCFDEPVGRHQDRHYMAQSKVNEMLSAMQEEDERQFWVYTDKGYNVNTHVRTAAHGPGPVTDLDRQNNYIMSQERVGIEWGFGKLRARCPYVEQVHKLKLQEADVRERLKVAVLLTNMHTCLQ